MKIRILNQNDSEINFTLEETTPSFANALRRTMMTEVPTMAIEWVDFKNNSSAIPDELLANRLGQIPLTFDKKAYDLLKDCKCEDKGCSRCQAELILKKKGPDMVYSGDMKSKNKDVAPVFDKTPIVELFEGQELEFEAIAQLGFGRDHAKWQAAVVGYKNVPNITINSRECKGEDCKKCVERCGKGLLKLEKKEILVTDPLACNMCMQCEEVCPTNAIKVEAVASSFIFNVEKASGLSPEDIVSGAVEILKGKMKEFDKSLGKLK